MIFWDLRVRISFSLIEENTSRVGLLDIKNSAALQGFMFPTLIFIILKVINFDQFGGIHLYRPMRYKWKNQLFLSSRDQRQLKIFWSNETN